VASKLPCPPPLAFVDVHLCDRLVSSGSAAQDFEGREAEELNNELSQLMHKMLTQNSALDLKSLCIIPGTQCWALYIDALVLDFGGNLFDAIMVGVRAALANTRLPNVTVLEDAAGNKEIEISDDSEDVKALDVTNVPLTVTLHKVLFLLVFVFFIIVVSFYSHRTFASQFKKKYVVDASLQEEQCSEATLVVALNKAGNICLVQKGGHGTINPSTLTDMIQSAKKIGLALIAKLDEMLSKEHELGQAKQGFFA